MPAEGESASADPRRLLAHILVGFASNSDAHTLQPIAHRPTEFDLARATADGLRLQIEQDQSCARTIGHAEVPRHAMSMHPHGLDKQADVAGSALPDLIVRESL